MKKLLKLGPISCFILAILGCSNDDENIKEENSIVGTWKLIEIYNDTGDGSASWDSVENGYTYSFSLNGEFTSTRFSECSTGNYSMNSNKLTLDFNCDGFTTGIENPEGTFIEDYTFESTRIILVPTYLSCDEGCGWKFEKINQP